jgi:two-component system sensor histidine kinase CpxA
MRSLLIRIFISFWAIIVITIIAAAAIGFLYAERTRVTLENFDVGDAVFEASAALREEGREGLIDWLRSLPGPAEALIYVVDQQGSDLLGRPLPPLIQRSLRRGGERERRRPPGWPDTRHVRPARPFTQLVGGDGRIYTIIMLPPEFARASWLFDRGRAGIMLLALLVSAAVSYFLARTISEPVRRFRESANAIAGGDFDTRVAERVGKRRDEIGLLAEDFDRMTDELRRAWLQQTELTSNVSHELRSPLARLRVALELARRKTGELAELDKIDVETERLDQLIGQILEYSRLDADSRERLSTFDLGELLSSVVDDVHFEYGDLASKADIALDATAKCTVSGYPDALRSCFENVLRNAVQHGRDRGVVAVRLATEASQAVVEIEDAGGGVPDRELGKIFDPFYRATSGQESARQSGGLGLAIAARAAALNGGAISASNTSDGLLVEIRLPLAEAGPRERTP